MKDERPEGDNEAVTMSIKLGRMPGSRRAGLQNSDINDRTFLFWSGTSFEDPGPRSAHTNFPKENALQSKSRGPRHQGDKRLTD